MPAHGGYWQYDQGHATDYSDAATVYNLTVSGQTGYTRNITIVYHNHSDLYEYVCGNAPLPNSPKLWSNNSKGR
jgi:hypothetical protein